MSDRRAPTVSFYDKTKQFALNLPHALSQPARATAMMLFLHGRDDGSEIFVSVETLMQMTALTRSAQFRALKELMAAKLLKEDGWHVYPNGVKTRRRRLDLAAMVAARQAELAENHSATDGTVENGHSPTHGTQHSPTDGGRTVPWMAHKPSLNLPLLNLPSVHIPSGYCENGSSSQSPSPPKAAEKKPEVATQLQEAVGIWNAICGAELGRVLKLTSQRQSALKARLRDDFGGDLEKWRAYCRRMVRSDWLCGRTAQGDWKAGFDFAVNPNKCVKILEGAFDNKGYGANIERRFQPSPGTV